MTTTLDQQNPREPVSDSAPSWRTLALLFLQLGFIGFGDSEKQITRMYQQVVLRRRWLSPEEFLQSSRLCQLLPGNAVMSLAMLSGFLKQRIPGAIATGATLFLPGAGLMMLLSWAYITYSQQPEVTAFFFILKPALLGIFTAGVIKLAAKAIHNYLLAAIALGAFVSLSLAETNLLLVFMLAGSAHLLVALGRPRLQRRSLPLQILGLPAFGLLLLFIHPHWLRVTWLFFKANLFSLGGSYGSLAFLYQGAVADYRWVSVNQLLDGLALTAALPGSFTLFSIFVGYLAGGPTGAILATCFIFLSSLGLMVVIARYGQQIYRNEALHSFLGGALAGVVGVLIFMIIDIAPMALVGTVTVTIAISTFLAVALLNLNGALVAAAAIVVAILHATGAIAQIK
jgi:chromate transporter